MPRSVDYSALTKPAVRAEVITFRRNARLSGATWASVSTQQVIGLVVGAIVGLFFLFGAVIPIVISVVASPRGFEPAYVAPVLVFLVIFGLIFFVALRGIFGTRKWETWMRLSQFASANDLVFSPIDPNPSYPGEIFSLGSDRNALNHLRSAEGRFFDMGNYQYITGSGKSRQAHNWGFLAFNLDRSLPNMVLDSKANNGIFGSNLPAYLSKDQVLSLEGDFDSYFTLYCPREYERDALYVFTPDLMALLIDEAAPFDVEIVDNWMFVYSSKPFTTTDPAIYQRLFRIIDTVGAKTLSQTDRYADDRIGDPSINMVAPQGRRLKRGFSVFSVIVVVVVVGFWLYIQLRDFLH